MATAAVGSAPATSTLNIDVASIVRRWNRIIVEIDKSNSANVSLMMPADLARLSSYLVDMTAYQAFVVSNPILDCPETGPQETPLQASPTVGEPENDTVFDAIQLAQIARDEIANSQSGRLATNLLPFDYGRQQAYIQKLTNLVTYMTTAARLDLPESSPSQAVTGKGALGI